ncbi:MAG: hypothetical protein WBF58_13985 [Xanthobacteraceae bacterium]
MNKPVQLLGRVVVGTAVYVVIVMLATSLPAAAGLMLTFPALNGLAFYFSEDGRAAAIARTMLWMPVVNGVLCAAYVLLFLLLARTLPPTPLGWGLLLAVTAAWFAWVSRQHVRAGIAPPRQLLFATAVTIAGLALAAATMLLMLRFGISPPRAAIASNPADASWLTDAFARSSPKIALFALTLAIVLSAIEYVPISDAVRGILAGLPIVPFGGLVGIGGDPSLGIDARIQMFLGMIGGLWLGPPIALWYVYYFSRYLSARRRVGARLADSFMRFAALLAAWLVTFVVIVVIAYMISALSARTSTP